MSKYFRRLKKSKTPTSSPNTDDTQDTDVGLQSRGAAEPKMSQQTPVTGTPPTLNTSRNMSGGLGGGGGGGMSLFQGLNVVPPVPAAPQAEQEGIAGGHAPSPKGKDSFTESSNFSFITGGEGSEGGVDVGGAGGSSPGPVQELRANCRPVSVGSEVHELEESSGEGGFSFLNATTPKDEAAPPVETPPPQKAAKTPPLPRPPQNSPATQPTLPPDVVQQPRTGPALVVGGAAKKGPRKKKMKAARPGGVSESSDLVNAEATSGSANLLDYSQQADQPADGNLDQLELVNTGSERNELPHNLHPSPVTARSKTEMWSAPVPAGGVGQMKPVNDTPTPSGTGKDVPAASKRESKASTPDVVNASTSRGDSPASKVQTPASKEDPPIPKEDPPTPKEDPPTPKEDPPTPKEDLPTPKEDPPTPNEDPPIPYEDPPTPREDTPPAEPQDPLESLKERVKVLRSNLQTGLTALWSKMAAARADCTTRFDGLLKRAEQRIKWRSHLATLCRQEEEALSEENYSWAEQLKEEIEQLGKDLEEDRPVAMELMELLPVAVEMFAEVFKEEVSLRTKALQDVEMHREELTAAADETTDLFEGELMKQEAEVKTLSDDVDERNESVAKQQEQLSIKEKELFQQMSEKCEDFEHRKSELQEEITAVEDEIEGLEKRLQTLRARRTELVDGISEQDREIALAKGSFEEEEAAMKGVRDEVAKQQEELKERQAKQQDKMQAISSLKETHYMRRNEFQEVLESLATEVTKHQGRVDEVAMETENMKLLEGDFLPDFSPSSELLSLQEEEKAKCELVQTLAEELVSLQAELMELRGQLSELRSTIPRLEDGKKAAVTARNYKEAGRLNEELKAKVARERELAVEADSLLANSEATSLRLDDVKHQLLATKEEVSRREQEEEVGHLQKLSECCKRVEQLKAGCNEGESPFSDLLSHSVAILSCMKEEKTKKNLEDTGGN